LRFYPGVVAIIWIARRATSPLTALADKKRSPSLSLLALGRFGDASGGDMGATRRNSKENLSGQSGEGWNAAPSTTAESDDRVISMDPGRGLSSGAKRPGGRGVTRWDPDLRARRPARNALTSPRSQIPAYQS
jgi:hypothetical protein